MSITKQVIIDKIEVLTDGTIQVREATTYTEEGVSSNPAYNRWCLIPGQTITDQTAQIQAIAGVVWTEGVIAAYREAHPAPKP